MGGRTERMMTRQEQEKVSKVKESNGKKKKKPTEVGLGATAKRVLQEIRGINNFNIVHGEGGVEGRTCDQQFISLCL